MIGTRLSHYQILEEIGAGGMGVVYRARDERLERDVAIKVLPAGALADDAARRRFRREALALSKLNHPNIETVHDFDTHEGTDFLVLELVHGTTLAERAASGPLPEREISSFGVQLCEGLSAAHRESVLHRDVKPANLRVTPEGRLKILDFGLARRLGPTALATTESVETAGVAAGTLPYMSPEQLRAERLDERSDVYAVGATLYELACGRRAFPQESAPAVIAAVIGEPPDPPREVNPRVSADLERIIGKCLEKDPEDRYQSARELAVDLKRLGQPSTARGSAAAGRRARRGARRPVVAVGIAALAVVAAGSLLLALNAGGLRDRLLGRGGSADSTPSLAVLPLANLSGDPGQEFFADGMTDELITRLAQVGALRVISRSSVMPYKGTQKPLRQIAKELGVRMIVEGTVARGGDLVRISARLVEAATGRPVWAESYERTLSNVLAIQGDVARAVVEKVRVQMTPGERGRVAATPAVNPEAHEAYLRGLAEFNGFTSTSYRSAVTHFQRSIQIDPGYAPAYAGLASVYLQMSGMFLSAREANERARAAANKALEIDPNLGSARAALAYVRMVYDYDREGAEREFRHALELAPGDLTVHQSYGIHLIALGRFDEALEQFRLARQIDPMSATTAAMSLWPLFEGRRYAEAVTEARSIVLADPASHNARLVLGEALFFSGSREEGIEEVRKACESDSSNPHPFAWLGHLYARSGDRVRAMEVWRRLDAMKREHYVQPYSFAIIHIGLGEREKALTILEKSLEERSDELLFAKVDPALDPLRNEPRFQAILKQLHFD